MSTPPQEAFGSDQERHLAAVARSLQWAEESAAHGDYADALSWIQTVEAIGDELTQRHRALRLEWRNALAESRPKKPNQTAGLNIGV